MNRIKYYLRPELPVIATGSVYAVVSIFLIIFLLREQKKKLKALYAIMLVLCLVGLFLTKSRGSYAGFAIGALVVLWFISRTKLRQSMRFR
ncbi:MAG: hypothetical protein HQ569_10210 [Actinobacteria bacterium]|nr:hypothetical protein [Actinomycetota bacterium]